MENFRDVEEEDDIAHTHKESDRDGRHVHGVTFELVMPKMAVDEGLVVTLGVADQGDESARLGYQ